MTVKSKSSNRGSSGSLEAWTKDGKTKVKFNVSADRVSHLEPRSESRNPPPRDGGREHDSLFANASNVRPVQGNNKINFSTDKPSLEKILYWKNPVDGRGDQRLTDGQLIRRALGLQPNTSNDEVLKEIQRKSTHYYPDFNPDYAELSNAVTRNLIEMRKIIKQEK